MALVKKLQPGGTIDQNAVREKAGKYLEELNLSSKDARKAVAAFDKLSAHLSTPEGGKSFSVDPLTNTYKITGPGSEAFQGSPEEIHRGFLSGNLKIKNDQDAMSVAALLYNKALNEVKGPTTTTTAATSKSDISIGDLGDYVKETIYGGSTAGAASDIHKLKSDEERQKKTLEFANKYTTDYLSRVETNKESFNATDIDKVKELQSAIKSGDWENFRTKAYALKWNPEEFLMSDQEKQNIKEETATKKLQDTSSAFTKAGIGADAQETLYKGGYTDIVSDWTPQGIDKDWFQNLLAKNSAVTVYNPNTKLHKLVAGSQYFDYAEKDRFSPYYGYSIKNAETGGVHAYNPTQSVAENIGAFGAPDEWNEKNVARQIKTNLPGVVWGYSDERDGKFAKDVLGRRDFTKVLTYETNGQKVKLTKSADGKYRDEQGVEVPIQLKGYGPTTGSISTTEQLNRIYKDPNNPLSDIKPKAVYTDLNTLETQLREQEQLGKTTGVDEDRLSAMAAHLRWTLQNSINPADRSKALELYGQLSSIFTQNPEIKPSSNYFYKVGGKIRKGQKGMTAEQYIKKYNISERTPSQSAQVVPTKLISSRGRVGNMDAFEVASLIGTGLSFIPGIGAIGGGISTISDIAHDIKKDGFQMGDIFNLNTAANLGFTALSLFGAGGVKALAIGAKAAKAGKAADLGFDLAKTAEKASLLEAKAIAKGIEVPENILRVKKLGNISSVVSKETLKAASKTDDIAKIALKEGEVEALRSAGYIDEAGKLIKTSTGESLLQTDLGSAFGVSKSSLTAAGGFARQYAKEPFSEAVKFVGTQGSKLAKNKVVGQTATIGMIGAGGMGAYNAAQDMLSAPEDTSIGDRFSRIKTSDLKGVLMGASLAKNWYSGAKNARAILNQTEARTLKDAERSITVGDKEFKVSDKVELPKGSRLPFKKDEAKQVEKLKADLKSKLIGTDSEKDEAIAVILKDNKLPASITNNLEEAETAERMLRSTVNDRFSDTGRSIREYARAKKIIERQITSPGQLRARWKAPKVAKASVQPKIIKAPKVTPPKSVKSPEVVVTPPSKVVKKKEVKPGEFYGSLFKEGGVLRLLNGGKGSRIAPIKINIAPDLARLKQQANTMPALKQPTIPVSTGSGIMPDTKRKKSLLYDESGRLTLHKFDTTDLANTLMYINTTQANKAIGRAQSRAAISGLYSLPYMYKQYNRVSDPYALYGAMEAAKVQSKVGRLAGTTADIDKSIATNLEGTRQAGDIRAKYNLAGVDRLDKLRQQQAASDFEVDVANTETLAENRAMFAGTAQKLDLIGANEINAQNAALNNWWTAWHSNQPIKAYKAGQQELLAAYKKPSLLAASEEYKNAISEETGQKYMDLYKKKGERMPEYKNVPWEASSEYAQWQNLQKTARERYNLENKPVSELAIAQLARSPYFKQGGSISLEDKVKLERYRNAIKRNDKEVERAYKSIKENNEMLQKALIKVFK